MTRLLCAVASFSILGWSLTLTSAAEFAAQQDNNTVTVMQDGQLVTRYIAESGGKPILWPLIGPTGKEMTRGYPMREATPEEKSDHPHHRSCWFTHGTINGVDFWSENPKHGTIRHREFVSVNGGKQAKIVTRNDWIGPDGAKVCEDERRIVVDGNSQARWFDFDITLYAKPGAVTFGDTKEGTFGVRVAETIKVEAKQGGRIVTSEGLTDAEAWGKRAAWVDYYGPVQGETVGLAILNHPTSFRYPVPWHVRTYGLFAANPFGLKDFAGGAQDVDGTYQLPAGESLTMRFRVVLHKGDEKEGGVAEHFSRYRELQ